uniref:DNA cross-link repair 1A protein n=1 Tax=Anopheles culicifacies TaxID=139723 RepID=A0A182MBG0_9DIPT
MGKGKAEVGTPKYLANKMKAKGLQKLRWYCQMCEKQCRDENGFKCHTMSESHQRQILLFADNAGRFIDGFSSEFLTGYLQILRRQFGTKRVAANKVYQEYIADRHHLHMNATKWHSLSDFVKYLGRNGHCVVDETDKGWFITYIDRDPETLAMQEKMAKKQKMDKDDAERLAEFIEEQVRRGKNDQEPGSSGYSELKREHEEETIKIDLKLTGKLPQQSAPSVAIKRPFDLLDDSKKDKKPKSSLNSGDSKKMTALDELIKEEEQKKEKNNPKSSTKKNGSLTVPRKDIGKARRKICPSTNIKMLTKKYFDDSQKRITNFFNKEEDPERVGYCRVLKESVMPAIITGDLDMEKMLCVTVDESTDQLSISQNVSPFTIPETASPMSASQIMERIERVQSACYDPVREDWNMERVAFPIEVPTLNNNNEAMVDTTLCKTEPTKMQNKPRPSGSFKTPSNKIKPAPVSSRSKDAKSVRTKGGKKIVCPSYKIIAGTNFAVDAFRYGDIEGVTHYFLTHFHADHYIGLKKTFAKPLIMSPITARLVKAFINVSEEFYRVIDLHESIIIDDVEIIALDANHCPGGIMFLFRLPNGSTMLHTGDFRASPEMEEYPEFWNFPIDCIYLDTTYLSSKYAFKSQWESVADAREAVVTFLKKHIGVKVLIVCGSYLIGKEKVWLELAMTTGMKVWTEPNRLKALKAIADPQYLSKLVADPLEANIHVLAMNKLSYDELTEYMNQFPDQYESVIAIRPSGWEKNSKPQYRGRINIVGIEYSEHSSFDELKRFVQFIRPREVISTVPYGNSNQNRTPTVPASWYQGDMRPQRKALQLSITSFITPVKGVDVIMPNEASSSLRIRSLSLSTKSEANDVNMTKSTSDVEVIDVADSEGEEDIKFDKKSENGELSFDKRPGNVVVVMNVKVVEEED